jgi:hypothetical protein
MSKERFDSVKLFVAMIVCGSVFVFMNAYWEEQLGIKELQEDVEMGRTLTDEDRLWKEEMRRLGIDVDD